MRYGLKTLSDCRTKPGGRDTHPTIKFILCGTGILLFWIYRWVGAGFRDDCLRKLLLKTRPLYLKRVS
jgi:hypothetical protein